MPIADCKRDRPSSLLTRYNPVVAFRIREYRSEDFRPLWRIDQQCFAPGISYSQRELAHYMAQRGAFTLVAETAPPCPAPSTSLRAGSPGRDKGGPPQILGFVVGQRLGRGMGHIITIDVLPEAQRSGVGSQLMAASEQRLLEAGCRSIYLETAVDNEKALRFYKRHGYFVLKTIPRYYLNKIDALLMGKRLA